MHTNVNKKDIYKNIHSSVVLIAQTEQIQMPTYDKIDKLWHVFKKQYYGAKTKIKQLFHATAQISCWKKEAITKREYTLRFYL